MADPKDAAARHELPAKGSMMKRTDGVSSSPLHAATIRALRLIVEAAAYSSTPDDRLAFEDAGEIVAQAMWTLVRLQLGNPDRATRGLASSSELSEMIDSFLAIRDSERRRHCLTILRDCAIAEAEQQRSAG